MPNQQRDVFRPFAQGGQGDVNHIDGIEQFRPEGPVVHRHVGAVAGRGDETDVGQCSFGDVGIVVLGTVLDRLGEHQCNLAGRASISCRNSVPPAASLIQPATVPMARRSKQGLFHRIRFDRRAGAGDERLALTRTVEVDHLGERCSAGTGFAGDQHRQIRLTGRPGFVQTRLHLFAAGDDLVEAVLGGQFDLVLLKLLRWPRLICGFRPRDAWRG